MVDNASATAEHIRVAEVIATLSLATDLGIGVPLEYGLESTLLAMRLASLHAVHHMVGLARRAREAVIAGRYAAFHHEVLTQYRSGETLAPPRSPGSRPAARHS